MIVEKKIVPGVIFTGNVNGAKMQIVAVKEGNATVKDMKSGKEFQYGLKALTHCDITIDKEG